MIAIFLLAQLAAPTAPTVIPTTIVEKQGQPEAGTVPVLKQDTPVELMAPSEVSTADVAAGTVFKLRVNRAIELGGRIVVPVGTPAFGQVISASESGGLGKSGLMTAKLLAIRLGTLEIPLEGELSAKGTGAGSAGVAVLFTGWVGLFHRGNNAKIKAGEILTGYVARDTPLPSDVLRGPGQSHAATAGQ